MKRRGRAPPICIKPYKNPIRNGHWGIRRAKSGVPRLLERRENAKRHGQFGRKLHTSRAGSSRPSQVGSWRPDELREPPPVRLLLLQPPFPGISQLRLPTGENRP